jgi:hypothetical protein
MRAFRKLLAVVAAVLIVSIPVTAWTQRQNIYDAWRLHTFNAPADIAQLATQDTMNAYGQKLFYVMHPQLDDKQTFNTHCRDDEQTIVLGCHISRDGIYLLRVDDQRLTGVEQVTAAHEMLHEAYERLGITEKQHINELLQQTFAASTDERLKQTIEEYRSKDPSVVPNELHSILGTEMRNLPAELENYYKRYFDNRLQIVTYSEQYEEVFTDRHNAVTQYDAQLASLKTQIDALKTQLSGQQSDLSNRRSQMDRWRSSGQVEQYNAAVPGFNQEVQSYNGNIDSLRSYIDQYNTIVEKRNAIASEEQSLVQSIDSREIPQQQ